MLGEPIREMRLDVRPGLFALRYVGSADVRTAPTATVRPVAASVASIDVISVPGLAPGELAAPGSSVILVVSAAGAVEISLTAFRGSQNLDARFSLDLLGSAEPSRIVASSPAKEPTLALADARPLRRGLGVLELVAHVSRRGNVGVDEQGWIAGPRAPSSVEALQIHVRNCDLGVAAQFRNTESRAAWSTWMTPGALVGVPQKACALTGLRLKLVGSEADHYDIAGEALFLGTPKMSATGGDIEFVAPGELDPLIGIKLSLIERAVAAQPQSQERLSRVRVFR